MKPFFDKFAELITQAHQAGIPLDHEDLAAYPTTLTPYFEQAGVTNHTEIENILQEQEERTFSKTLPIKWENGLKEQYEKIEKKGRDPEDVFADKVRITLE